MASRESSLSTNDDIGKADKHSLRRMETRMTIGTDLPDLENTIEVIQAFH